MSYYSGLKQAYTCWQRLGWSWLLLKKVGTPPSLPLPNSFPPCVLPLLSLDCTLHRFLSFLVSLAHSSPMWNCSFSSSWSFSSWKPKPEVFPDTHVNTDWETSLQDELWREQTLASVSLENVFSRKEFFSLFRSGVSDILGVLGTLTIS